MQKLQGWKAFEEFVSTLYENDNEAIVDDDSKALIFAA
jgi:hypothetical protein